MPERSSREGPQRLRTLRQVFLRPAVLAGWLIAWPAAPAAGQVECAPWGNLTGMRVDGQLFAFETSLRAVRPDWSGFTPTVKYKQKPRYQREGARQTVQSKLEGGLAFTQEVEDAGRGEARIHLQITAESELDVAGVYFCVDLPACDFAGATLEVTTPPEGEPARTSLGSDAPAGKPLLGATGSGVRVVSARRRFEITSAGATEILVRRDRTDHPTWLNDPQIRHSFVDDGADRSDVGFQVYFALLTGSAARGRTASCTFTLKADGEIDREPVHLRVDATRPGRVFEGVGGNFRLQFPRTDPQVIEYNLDNLRVGWGRVAMPWNNWHRDENNDPLAAARTGRLSQDVRQAMEMGRTLRQRGVPVIVSAWTPPGWAKTVEPQPAGQRGTPLNPAKMEAICESIGKYLLFLKERYGVEAPYFSFNEPEEGVDIRQTAEEHRAFVKAMGARLNTMGLATKMLLGDTAHFTPKAHGFIEPVLEDPEAARHVGAIAFHTWRGCPERDLALWVRSAKRLNVPLIVTEAGPDAHAHEYPDLFLEPSFQLQEIDLYVRVCALAEPLSIMQWQLTTDYSVLAGGGVYGGDGPLRPTQRFWNLKQLGATPPGAFALPITCDRPAVSCAAFGDISRGAWAIHVVNTGPQREATLEGLPEAVRELRLYVTDRSRGMAPGETVPVSGGRARFVLPALSFTSLH